MTKDNLFQTITLMFGAVAFIVVGVVIALFTLKNENKTTTTNTPLLSETQQIINFLSLADGTQEGGLYGEADPESLQISLQELKDSLSTPITTEQDANLYMIYWAATAVNNCVHLDAQNNGEPQQVSASQVDECINNVRSEVEQNIAQMSNNEQQILVQSAESWNVLTSIVEYYNLFIQNNFVQAIQQNANNQDGLIKQLTNELDAIITAQGQG